MENSNTDLAPENLSFEDVYELRNQDLLSEVRGYEKAQEYISTNEILGTLEEENSYGPEYEHAGRDAGTLIGGAAGFGVAGPLGIIPMAAFGNIVGDLVDVFRNPEEIEVDYTLEK